MRFWWLRQTGGDEPEFESWNSVTGSEPRGSEHTAEEVNFQDLNNDVYLGWHMLLQHLDMPHHQPYTPRELAHIAIDRGMDQEGVLKLTQQFENVRYGRAFPTPEREQKVRDALSRLGID